MNGAGDQYEQYGVFFFLLGAIQEVFFWFIRLLVLLPFCARKLVCYVRVAWHVHEGGA